MFTGIVEHIGEIEAVTPRDGNTAYTIKNAEPVLSDCHIGDLIAVNGVCLTVLEFSKDKFTVGVSEETLDRTNFRDLRSGLRVNLERAMSMATRFGGHYVQGHVDGTATITKLTEDNDKSLRFTFTLDKESIERHLITYIVEKGFVTVDGTLLTVTGVDNTANSFSIMMIEHTQKHSVVGAKKTGDVVNIEVDVSAKSLEKQVEAQVSNPNSAVSKIIRKLVAEEVAKLVNK